MASRVTVVQFSEERSRRFPSTTLVQYLSRHGIHAELEARSTSTSVESALVSYAERHGAGIIVMGGYGHSRAGEFLFGGMTRALIKECPIALVISH
jgi:nucleotide-binding universal stress UspA family protein